MSNSRILKIDFEFNQIVEEFVNLVCCCTFDPQTKKKKYFWLHGKDNPEREVLRKHLKNYDILMGYSCIAEARSLLSLGLDPLNWRWIDLFLEYRCLSNHNDRIQWGLQLVEGKVKHVSKPKPKWQRTEEDLSEGGSFKATHSLAEATYKLTGVIRDTIHKTQMRNLIISDPEFFTAEQKSAIMNYCMEDVVSLPEMWEKMQAEYLVLDPSIADNKEIFLKECELRGKFAALTALMENGGYPIDIEKTKNFSSQVGNILYDLQSEINSLFPDVKPFKWDKAEQKYKWNQLATRAWIETNFKDKKWLLTDGGKKNIPQLSLSLEAFQRFFDFKHDYPKDSFGAQMVRFLKLKQSLYGFVPTKNPNKKTLWSFVGSDGRVRPYTNIYGAQSSRSQPSSTGFMFLKPAWMRSLVSPSPGKAMAGIDYGSEEFFISALNSGDENMISAYLSGDVYLAFAKSAEMVPEDATKSSHKFERDLCKSTVLGISFLMSKYGLAIKLTADSGEEWTEDEAEKMVEKFYASYPQLKEYQDWIVSTYNDQGFLQLPCGWYCFGDNDNFRSVTNVPVQGMGASILRKAVELAFERGLYVAFTLHDALYIEYDVGDEHKIKILADCMREAFQFYFETPEEKDLAGKIKLDPFAWSPDYKDDSEFDLGDGLIVPAGKIYLDDRAIEESKKFSKYFEPTGEELL